MLRYSSGDLVVVSGRNLRLVYFKVLEHQVKYLAEADRASDTLSDAATSVVTRLHVIEPGKH